MKMNILYIYCFIVNIIIIYCNEINELKQFFQTSPVESLDLNKATECNTANVKCEDGSVTELSFNFGKVKLNLDFNQFPKLPNLSKISIFGDIFSGKLPAKLLELPKLRYLEIRFSNITEIPKEIKNSNSFEEIILSSNQITEFPYQFKNLENLIRLELEDNNIKGPLTKEINNFKKLKILNISNNSMNNELFISENLEEVYANNNQFNSLVNSEANSKLNKLIINNNEIDKISEDFFSNMYNLNTLNISSNKIKELPISLYILSKLESFDISNNKLLKAEITTFSTKINECNFDNTNIECYDKGICKNIDDAASYNECSDQVVQKIIDKISNIKFKDSNKDDDNNKGGNNRILTIIIIIAIIIFAFSGFVWMYKSNKKRKDAREADINVSLTVKPSNYYNSNDKNNVQNNSNNNFNNNTQTSFERILPESLTTSSSPPISPVQSQDTYSNLQNLDMNMINNNSLLVTSQSQIMQNTSTEISANQIVNDQQNSNNTITSPLLAANTSNMSIVSPIISPVLTGNTSIVNNVTLQNPNLVHINDTNGLTNGTMNIGLINNNNNNILINNFMPNQDNVQFVNGQSNGQPITSFPLTVRTSSNNINNYDPDLLKKLKMVGGSSSSSSNNNNNGGGSSSSNVVFTNDYGLTPEEIDDVRLKKKILQEKELSEKYNLLNNKNPNDQSDNDNLPPYSQF